MFPFRCPHCGTYVNFTYFDTAGRHWQCPNCKLNDMNYAIVKRITYNRTTVPERKENKPCMQS